MILTCIWFLVVKFLKCGNMLPYHKETLAISVRQFMIWPISLLLWATQDSLPPMSNCPNPSHDVASTMGIHHLEGGDVSRAYQNPFVEDMFTCPLMILHIASHCVRWWCSVVCNHFIILHSVLTILDWSERYLKIRGNLNIVKLHRSKHTEFRIHREK